MRSWPRIVLLLSLAIANVLLACLTPTLAEATSAPDSARLAWVRFQVRHFDDVRIVTGDSKITTHRPDVSSDGLRFRRGSGTGRITSWTPPQEHLVSWEKIESIHAREGSGSGAVVGALLGLAVGLVIEMGDVFSHLYTRTPSKSSGKPILLGIAGGAALGALADRPGPWEPVYP